MKILKCVTLDYKSPGNYGKKDYSPGNIITEKKSDPDPTKQCAKGLHGFIHKSNKTMDWNNIILDKRLIELKVLKKKIIFSPERGVGKYRFSECKSLGDLHGRKTFWKKYSDGNKEWERVYFNGVLRIFRWWHKNGQKQMERHFTEDGIFIREDRWYENGQKEMEIHYTEDGILIREDWWFKDGTKL